MHYIEQRNTHLEKHVLIMKNLPSILLYMAIFAAGAMTAQETSKKVQDPMMEEEEEGPLMYKFEPDFITTNEKRSKEIAMTRNLIENMDISDNKRRRLLRDLYKNEPSKRLQKVLVADVKFEDVKE